MDREIHLTLELLSLKRISVRSADRILRALELLGRDEVDREEDGASRPLVCNGNADPPNTSRDTEPVTHLEGSWSCEAARSALHRDLEDATANTQESGGVPAMTGMADMEADYPLCIENGTHDTKLTMGKSCLRKLRSAAIPAILAFELLVLVSLLTYAVMSYTHGQKVTNLQNRFAMERYKQSAKVGYLEPRDHEPVRGGQGPGVHGPSSAWIPVVSNCESGVDPGCCW